jgi:hypothetical protein
MCYCKLLAFVCVIVTKLCLLIGICNRRIWLIDWLIDSLTGATVGCSLFPLVSTPSFSYLLNIPSYILSSGPFYFHVAPLFSLLSRSSLSSIPPPVPLFPLLIYLFSYVLFFPHFFLWPILLSYVLSLLFPSILSSLVSSVPFCFLFYFLLSSPVPL